MKRLLLWLVILGLSLAQAQIVRNFTSRYSINTTGDIVLIGNTLMTCSTTQGTYSAQCANARAGASEAPASNNDYIMIYVDADTDASTSNSSSANLNLPTDATVLWAGLYWGAEAPLNRPDPDSIKTIRFRTPSSGGYLPLTATQTDSSTIPEYTDRIYYQSFVEVTGLVRTAGSGTYWAANVQGYPGDNRHAGWSLVVVYRHPSEPMRHLNVFDGYAVVRPGTSVSTTISGFLTPTLGPVNVRLGTVAYEGDRGIGGDRLRLNSVDVSNSLNPADNYFNSTISDLGAHVTTKNPNYNNQLGFDIDRIQITGLISNSASSATVEFSSLGEAYFPGVLTFAINIYAPDLTTTFSKSVADLNRGQVLPGDILEYTISFTNTGQDGATNVVLRDPIPAGTQYVPGSLQVLTNTPSAPTGTFTDANDNDIAEYSPACSELSGSPPCVRFRLGSMANATQGGQVPHTRGASVRFQVQVLPSAAGQTISNTALVSYNSQTLGTAFNQTASASVSSTVPTTPPAPPGLSKAFSPSSIPAGGFSTLTVTLSNPNTSPATLTQALVDNLPTGLVVASPPAASTTCPNGSVSASAGGTSASLSSGAQIPANSSCTFSVDVTGSTPGNYTNTLPAGALRTDLGNNTAPASASLSILGASLSGRIYADVQPNGVGEPGENWSGGPVVYVNLVQSGTVAQSVTVNAGSGLFTFSAVPPGSYTLVVAGSPTATTPTAPAGWLFINPNGSRSITMGSNNLSGQDFGLFHGSRIRGTVFRDDGLGGGTANDALQNGGEPGIPNVLVTASDGTNVRSATTDTGGSYTLFIPAGFGPTLTLSHPLQPATGSNVNGASVSLASGYNSPAAASRAISGFAAGQFYEGYNFGVVRESRLSPDQSGQSPSPGTITYSHLYRPGTLGTVNLSQSGGSYTYALRRDVNCDGDFADAGEGFQPLPQSFTVDATWPRENDGSLRACALELQVVVPAGLPAGRVDMAQLQAALGWVNNPAITDTRQVFDTTTVVSAGGLRLFKEVRNVSAGSPFAVSVQGRPGEVLEYRISYQNIGSQPIFDVVLSDPIPFFTTLVQNAYGGTGELELACPNGTLVRPDLGSVSSISLDLASQCSLDTAPNPSGPGFSPALLPAQGGYFLYQVRIQ